MEVRYFSGHMRMWHISLTNKRQILELLAPCFDYKEETKWPNQKDSPH